MWFTGVLELELFSCATSSSYYEISVSHIVTISVNLLFVILLHSQLLSVLNFSISVGSTFNGEPSLEISNGMSEMLQTISHLCRSPGRPRVFVVCL